MQTKPSLIAAAVLLGAAATAHAQVSVYGLIDMSYGKSIPDSASNKKADFHSGGDDGNGEGNSTSRFGIKGAFDAGSNVKMNFKLESNGITSDGTVNLPFFGRAAWLGASGGFGEVRLGRQDSVPFQTMVGYDFNGASNGVSALAYSGVGMWTRGRQSRSLQYILPTLATGLKAQFGVVPKGNSTVAGQKDVVSGGVKYETGPISGAVAFQTKETSTSKDFASVAGSYDFGVAKVMLGYTDGGKGSSGGTGQGINAGVSASAGGFSFGLLASQRTDTGFKTRAVEAFVNRELLKNTYGYIEAGQSKPSGGASNTGYAAGVIFVF